MCAQADVTQRGPALPPGWSPRFFREGDEAGLLELLTSAFDRWPAGEITVPPIDHLRWKLRSDERALQSHSIAELDSRIVGARIIISQRIKLGARVLDAFQGVDAAVHPDYQGTGVMTALRRFNPRGRPDKYDVYFGAQSGHPAMPRLRKWNPRGTRYVKPVDILVAPAPFDATPPDDGAPWTLRQVREFDERIDTFSDEASQPFQRITVREHTYLNWRYCDARAGLFTVRLAEEAGRILGYIVDRTSYGTGHIADLLALPGRLDVVASLVRRSLARFRDEGVAEVECWCPPRHPYRHLLRDLGFVGKRRAVYVIHRVLYAPDKLLASLSQPRVMMHVMAGDTDLV